MDGWKVQWHIIPAGAEFSMMHWVSTPYTALTPKGGCRESRIRYDQKPFVYGLFRDGGRIVIGITAEGAISFIINPLPAFRHGALAGIIQKKHRVKIDCLW